MNSSDIFLQLLNKYKKIVNKINLRVFNSYEIDLLLSSKSLNFNIIKFEKSVLYIESTNLSMLYNYLSSLNIYRVVLSSKEKLLTVSVNQLNNEDIKKRSKLFLGILNEMFSKDIKNLSKNINEQKKNMKKMSDDEISRYKKELENVMKAKKEFVNIVERLSV